jgi:plastocyanin domain-containing protein
MKQNILAIFLAVVIIVLAVLFRNGTFESKDPVSYNNVFMENGVQIVEIKARGGYSPRHSIAKAGVPTVLRFDSKGSFDCSASLYLPSLKISKILDRKEKDNVEIGVPDRGLFEGTCGMGMYSFDIDFQ